MVLMLTMVVTTKAQIFFLDGAKWTRYLHLVVTGAAKGSEATLEGQHLAGAPVS